MAAQLNAAAGESLGASQPCEEGEAEEAEFEEEHESSRKP